MNSSPEMRFEFGKNWHAFVKSNFTQERCDVAKAKILQFTGRSDLKGIDFLDIGSGSGLHSLAAWQGGARRVHSFDYDPNSVAATMMLWEACGKPDNWTMERGDALDRQYMTGLGQWDFVYSWGVLHHTGSMWEAVMNAQATCRKNGTFYLALYSSDAAGSSMEFWLKKKAFYNTCSALDKERLVWWYVWEFMMGRDIGRAAEVVDRANQYRTQRGMDMFADVRDWLGGWPMEYAGDQDTVDLLEKFCGFNLKNISTGEACSEFLFERSGTPAQITDVKAMVARLKSAA
jgi:2-polyprenyl-6-hydroxyphenyl methylase/3-demethylubiquinone-9 3-methyltransferase